jgi:antirestriction protein ArdC
VILFIGLVAGELLKDNFMNIYTIITDRIINELKNGTVPWKKCWRTGLSKSLKTRKEYRGINLILLSNKNFTSQYYVKSTGAIRSML